jgi:hypothetical protein
MKTETITKTKLQRWLTAMIVAASLFVAAGLCHAQAPIVYNFASDLQGWSDNAGSTNANIVTWNPTGGSTGGGCMQIVNTNGIEMDPWVTLPGTLNQLEYQSVSLHMKVDSSSPKTGSFGSGGYGNLQAVFRDGSYSWDGIWNGAIYPPAANGWVTYNFTIAQPYKTAEQYLQFQLQANAGWKYPSPGPVTVYIDNVTITPLLNPWLIDAFTSDTSTSYSEETWTGAPTSISLNNSQDAGGGHNPAGALEVDYNWPVGPATFGQNWVIKSQGLDPSRYCYFELDVKVDPSSTRSADGTYGALSIEIRDGPTYGDTLCFPTSTALDSSFSNQWKHLKLALPILGGAGYPVTNSPAFDIIVRGSFTGPEKIYYDNITLSEPTNAPRIEALLPGSPGGVSINVDADGTANQYDQEGFSSPTADNNAMNFFWINQTPATYSITITNFPPQPAPYGSTTNPPISVGAGFDAHIYLVNGDSITANGNVGSWDYNQGYSGIPYNALDYVGLRVQNVGITNVVTYTTNASIITTNHHYSLASGVVAVLEWKTNAPSSNATNFIRFAFPAMASANGTWSLSFSDNTHGSIVAADNSVHNFTLPDLSGNFLPGTSLVQFGVAKNDALNNGANNNLSVLLSHVSVGTSAGTIYDDSFNGPGLTGKYLWRVASYYLDTANRVSWQPNNTAYWLVWGNPYQGYSPQSAANAAGPWGDAGVTYSYTDLSGTNHLGAIPAPSLPAGNTGFFRLTK